MASSTVILSLFFEKKFRKIQKNPEKFKKPIIWRQSENFVKQIECQGRGCWNKFFHRLSWEFWELFHVIYCIFVTLQIRKIIFDSDTFFEENKIYSELRKEISAICSITFQNLFKLQKMNILLCGIRNFCE